MAKDPKAAPKDNSTAGSAPDVRVGGTSTSSIEMGMGEDQKATTTDGQADIAEFGDDDVTTRHGLGEDEGADDTQDEGEQGGGAEDLGEFDPNNAEVVGKFEDTYIENDGSLNEQRLSEEWFKNSGGDLSKGGLNESTYNFLQDRYGLSREQIKSIEEGQIARQRLALTTLHDRAGGKANYDAAVEWGRKGGYTAAQRQRFNAAINSGDPDAAADAVEALMSRFSRATGRNVRIKGRRPATPVRDVTTEGRPAGGNQGYATRADWQKEFREARESGDQKKLAEVRRKLAASPWRNGK
jgi:hypothetical protein